MAKQNVTTPEIEVLGEEAINKTELFFENNGRQIIYIIGGLLALALVVFGYKSIVVEPKIEKGAAMLLEAQLLFESETPDYKVALEGNAAVPGFLEVIENFGSTPSGNLAKHYAGISYIHLGDLENAQKYLSQYKAVKGKVGSIINAQNIALQGDVNVEMGKYADAVGLYTKAAATSVNPLTAPMYLFKAALAASASSNYDKAKSLFEQITLEYPSSEEANKANKYLASMN